jgi:DNA-binding winged helix-turn-helix (wHTH) protein/TolB-like protein/tetratricopeptide (TPR) repeat protein
LPPDPNALYDFGTCRLDARQHQLFRDGAVVPLTPKAFDTLLLLVRRHGEVVSRQELVAQVWQGTFVEDAGLTRNISVLRKALAGDDTDECYIETVPKRGYRFVAPVQMVVPAPPSTGVPELATIHPALDRPDVTKWPAARLLIAAVLLLAIGAAVVAAVWNRTPETTIRSLAVLPFKPIAPVLDGEEYLGPAMADALITRLSRLRQLTLRPMRAVLEYSQSAKEARGIGRELQVDAVLDGRVHRDGERLRVTVELIRVSDGTLLWTGQFNDRFSDLFAVQDSVAQQVAESLASRLGAASADVSLRSRRPSRPEAYEVYLQGRYHWNKRTPESLATALVLFDKALAIDASYASAYAGLADAYSLLAAYRPSSKGESFVQASAAARRALAADDSLAEAHTSLGFVRFGHEWDWEGAEREYRRAIELDPNYATAHHWLAILLMVQGRAEESIEAIRRAERIDPLSPAIGSEVATLLWMARRHDEGIEQIARVQRLHPGGGSDLSAGNFYLDKGMRREAIEEFRRAQHVSDSPAMLSNLARAHAAAGEAAEAERLLRRSDDELASRGLYANPFDRAGVLAALGRRDDAFQELERAYRDRFIAITWLKVAPSLDPLRSDARYSDLLRRMHLD